MSTSIFYDPPIRAKRVYAGEVRVVDDIKFWDKATKVVNSRIHGDDGNLNFVVENSNKEVNFFTDQITFNDHDGTQLGYIDSSGTIHGLSVDGHATNVDISDLEDDLSSNAARVSTLETNLSSNAARISTLETDITSLEDVSTNLSSNAARVGTLETNLSSNAARVGTLETNLSSNASRVSTLETNLSSNALRVSTLETNLSSNALRVSTLEGNVVTIESNLLILYGNVETITSNINILHGNVETLSSNIDILHGNVETLTSNITILKDDLASNAARVGTLEVDLASNAARVGTLEVDLASNAARVGTLEVDLASNAARVGTLEVDLASNAARMEVVESNIYYLEHVGNHPQTGEPSYFVGNTATLYTEVTTLEAQVDAIEDDLSSNVSRIAAIESDYVTSSQLTAASAASAATGATAGGFFNNATGFFTKVGGAVKTLGDFYDELADLHSDDEDFTMANIVQKPSDWSSYPPLIDGVASGSTTLKSYVERKAAYEVELFEDGEFATLDASVSSLSTAVTNLNTELDSNAARIGTLETTTSTLDQSVSDLSTAVTNLNTELDSNAARVGTLETTTSTLDQSVSDLSTAVTTLTTDHESNVSRIETLEGSTGVTGLGDRVSVLESNIYYSYEDGVDENGDPVTVSANVHVLHGRVEELESNIFWSSSYVDENGDTVTLTGNVHVLNGVVEDLNDELDSNAARVSTLETDLTDNTSRIVTLETDLTDNTSRIVTLETDLTDNVSRIVTLETDLTDNVSRIVTLETDVTDNVNRIVTLETDLTNNVSRIETLEGASWTENATNDIYYNDGNVGIGTDSPSAKLHIKDTVNNETQVEVITKISTVGTLTNSVIDMSDTLYGGYIRGYHDAQVGHGLQLGAITSSSRETEAMTIRTNGNIGVGLINPSVKLHLKSKWADNDYDGLYIQDNQGVDFIQLAADSSDALGGSAGYLRLYAQNSNANGGVLLRGGGDSHINGGRLGIDETSPVCNLDVRSGTGSTTSAANWVAGAFGDRGNNTKHVVLGNLYGTPTIGGHIRGTGVFTNWTNLALNSLGGNVGIRTTEPLFPLHVAGSSGGNNSGSRRYFRHVTGLTADTGITGVSTIFATGPVTTNSYFISTSGAANSSDRRIKTDITDIDDGEALDILRLIKPKRYCYKDTIGRGSTPVYGFIAQEVRETLPFATLLQNDFIPNIYELSNVSQSNVITFTNFTTTQLNNHTSKIKLIEADGGETYTNIVEVIDDHTVRVDADLTEKMASVDETGEVVSGNQIFVYGEEVDDFVFLKKEAIFTIATAAVQEIDRQLQQEKAKVADLLARVEALEA